MLGDLGGWHFLIILAVVLLLFGATKLPALAKGVGQSVRIFRNEMGKPADGEKPDAAPTDSTTITTTTVQQSTPPDDQAIPHPKS